MNIPEPIEQGGVKFHWRQSVAKPDKVVTIIELDFGKIDMTSSQASNVQKTIVGVCRIAFGVPLEQFK